MSAGPRSRRWLTAALLGLILLVGAAVGFYWGDLVRTTLDPKVPFQTYEPPPAPDYAAPAAWALLPRDETDRPADVFFIAPTTYEGGRHWNAPIDDPEALEEFRETMAPNYVGPFVGVGRIFAPKYRQASLYSLLTLREDAREARRFAYADVQEAFRTYLQRDNRGRPFLVVGVEQGGTLGLRLLEQEVARDPALRARLVAAYLVDTVVPADSPPLPPCTERRQAGCLAAWARVDEGEFDAAKRKLDRALVWNGRGELENLTPRPALCFNPVLGSTTDAPAPARLHLGAANATGLEWGARPAFLARQVAAQCRQGVLHVSRPKSSALRKTGSWADRRKAPGFNLFYADLEADAQARLAAFQAR
ncbi:conserved hypothetical protein [Phenylobacterium zucineum HLK1]|uniref:DUF3089 domain-containing protein n=1 Tax=Phenylobacterium zucineum (strain HLK1) TaxID=450851 RepID=B4RAY3_PHEZH|nr:DUF3089 domain-containing protein [Phenylobacterium zucineum]ACG78034.1 conserved hypothetical protein [Phenylobacterium zucineum HLK1]